MSITTIREASPTTQATVRVATAIKELMARYGLVQADLQEVLGLSQTAVSKRLRGATPFDVNELDTVARYFKMTLAELTALADSPRPPGPQPVGRGVRVTRRLDGVTPQTHEYDHIPVTELLPPDPWGTAAQSIDWAASNLTQASLDRAA